MVFVVEMCLQIVSWADHVSIRTARDRLDKDLSFLIYMIINSSWFTLNLISHSLYMFLQSFSFHCVIRIIQMQPNISYCRIEHRAR